MSDPAPEKKTNRGLLRVLSLPIVKIGVIALFIVLVIAAIAVPLSGNKKTASAPNGKYIYPISTQNLLDMRAYDDGIAVLGTNSLFYMDDGGNEIDVLSHNYSSPMLRAAGKYTLLFDHAGKALRVDRSAKTRIELNFDAPILAADICKNGVYAYVLNADEKNFLSHLFIFSEKGDKLYEWGSSASYVTGIFLNEKGTKAIAICFGVDSASYFSRVYCFDFDLEDPIIDVSLRNETIYGAQFLSSGRIAVFSDRAVYSVESDDDTVAVKEYSAGEISHAAHDANELSAVSVNKYGNEQKCEVTVFSHNLKKAFDFSFEHKVTGICAGGKRIAVIMGQKAAVLNYKKIVGTVRLDESCMKYLIKNNRLYTLTPGGVCCDGISANTTLD